jgi:hypothetical protein
MLRLIADLLSMQDPANPHTLLTRAVVSAIIVGTDLVYAGFFGVFGAVGVYLIGIELMGIHPRWMFAPVGLAILVGLKSSLGNLRD